ncbi:MAG: LacI family DNA-binding transcriptional regulator [Flexilinea sp.]|jgi:LacI family transcriptional regulator
MTIRAKDIASMLNISPSTVSLVLNNKPGISEETRIQVIEKINELGCGYILKKPPKAGRNICFAVYVRTGEMIGESPFFAIFMEGLSDRVSENGYNLIFSRIDKTLSLRSNLDQIKSSNSDGLIILATEMLLDDLADIKTLGLPFILLDNHFYGEDIDSISINNDQGTYTAVKYLVGLGHKNIGYVKSKVFINSFQERFEGYKKALSAFNLEVNENNIYPVGYSEEASFADMKSFLDKSRNIPTALMSDNDMLAFGAIRALKQKGYKIPRDISVFGFDDRPICLLSDPKISTIHVPTNIFGTLAVDLLIERIENRRTESLEIEVSTKLIERNSSRMQ